MSGATYYTALCGDDYYHAGSEPPGVWMGGGCLDFGLSGEVKKEEFINLLDGYSPDGKDKLVQNAGKHNRQAGIDITFSAPKSVSVLWSQADEKTRQIIEAAHQRAVEAAVKYLELVGGFSRIGKDGTELEEVRLLFAGFQHGTSRAQDPQLHTHGVLLNVCKRADGSTGTIITKPMFENKMTGGAIYRAELAAALERDLGIVAERETASKQARPRGAVFHKGGLLKPGTFAGWVYEKACEWQAQLRAEREANRSSTFELKGVSRELMEVLSQRRQQITAALDARGEHGAVASQEACLKTRPKKEILPRGQLFERWQDLGREHGWSQREVEALLATPKPKRDLDVELNSIISRAIARATAHEIEFSERNLIRYACEEAQGTGISGRETIEAVRLVIDHSGIIERLVDPREIGKEQRLITWEMLDLEKGLVKMLDASKREPFRLDVGKRMLETITARAITAAKKALGALSEEQAKAVKHITTGKGTIKVVSGMAGTGKSTMLKAARQIWEKQGFKVIGAALAGKAAEGLLRESGIKSTTVAGLLASIEGGWTKLNRRSVVVIDEAGMIGTRTMARLVAETQQKGARLILVGDERQLQPIEAGAPFKFIGDRLGRVTLTKIRRQNEDWAKEAVHDFAKGDAKKALAAFAEKGLLTVKQTRAQTKSALVGDWQKEGASRPDQNLILATTNADVHDLNQLAQDARIKEGSLRGSAVQVNGNHLYKNDRILFTRRSTALGVENGSFATVLSVTKCSIVAELDSHQTVTIPLSRYKDIQLGYAVTTHKAQGITVENAMVLLGGPMQDREISYVQASRARGQTRFYIDRSQAGKDLSELMETMARTRQKQMLWELRNMDGIGRSDKYNEREETQRGLQKEQIAVKEVPFGEHDLQR